VFSGFQTALEGSPVQAGSGRVGHKIFLTHSGLRSISPELMVHFPVFPLVAGAIGCFVGSNGVVEIQGKVHKNVSDFTCLDVVFFDLGERLTGVPGTKRSRIVCELKNGYRGIFISLRWIISDVDKRSPASL